MDFTYGKTCVTAGCVAVHEVVKEWMTANNPDALFVVQDTQYGQDVTVSVDENRLGPSLTLHEQQRHGALSQTEKAEIIRWLAAQFTKK